MKLDRKIKTALDETRLLILGTQVLFGFLFESAFQEGFKELMPLSQNFLATALALLVLSISCLIAPSMQHRIVEQGESTLRLEQATTRLAAWSLLPLAVSLGLAMFVVFERSFGAAIGAAVGVLGAMLASLCWYGLAWGIGQRGRRTMSEKAGATPLATKIEQMLTEA